ncbi:MAG: tRNA (adenosine(37)-N6)-threonylcarbamoyltransferase complex dimerization subunit type 1 TsaB [Actinobacteria bacterium]|nr:tRNA (adenosine(37)-N6)-threonylcarbamoyltransferase complex dimerization subunit type 1 TsaB [Actinomycetota bacterium]MBO0834613.1 tRNA (adenosine(37)-N6)-threonylcarbamoyltransferase complex dimerization subunit type 1 TsaB [Actinomycetota bacterium]
MLLLALDTATPAVTVALHDGSAVVAEVSAIDPRRHGELLARCIDQVLRKAGAGLSNLTAIAVGIGPGPYTGLRVGVVTARVLGSALGIRTDGICSLDIIAAQVATPCGSDFLVVTDARRREVYWARYRRDGGCIAGPQVSRPADLPTGLPVAGEGAVLYPKPGSDPIEPRYPAAGVLACIAARRLAAGLPPDLAEPLYLRRPDAREPGRPKRVTP